MLLDKVIQRQVESGESDTAFAARLGLSFTTWRVTKRGSKAIGMRMIRGVIKNFPDLEPEVLIFLAQTAPKVAKVANKRTMRRTKERASA